MMKFGCILTVMLVSAGLSYADWLEFNAGCSDGTEPVINHGTTTENYISFDVELRGLDSESIQHDLDTYSRYFNTPGVRMLSDEGYPELPVVTCFVAVPDDVSLTVEGYRSCADFIENVTVYPAPSLELVTEGGITFYKEIFQKDASAYLSSDWFPGVSAEISGEFRLRDQRIAIIDVYPVQYLASEDSLRVWSDIGVFLEFSESAPILSSSDLGPYERLVGDMIVGYTPDMQPTGTPPPGSVYRPVDLTVAPPEIPDYVIITAGGLDGTWIDDLANYRAQLNGFDVLIATGDEIFTQFRTIERVLTPGLIRDYLETLWEFGSPGDRPSYLLLIGDHEDGSCTTVGPWFLPTFIESEFGYGNDEWFVYFDEPRIVPSSFPDMIVGRLPARDTDNLQDMIDLIEEYEEPVVGSGPASLQYRRYLTRLAGTPEDSGDNWEPSDDWTEDLTSWLGYQWDNYYCGDGENSVSTIPPNRDGSRMTSADWKAACNLVFNRGSQVAFYVDHGDFHMFSAGLNWLPPAPVNFGVPDSTFNDLDVLALGSFADHWHPFVMMLCCTAGTFNHTQYDHENINIYTCLCYEPTDELPPYDFESDCLAEDFIKNTDGGAIGVYAGSVSSYISYYGSIGKGVLESIYYRGITKQGEAIAAGRFSYLNDFWNGESFVRELGQFNLLGDPAVDIGDRMKFRNCCDLIISPADLEMNRYPTMSVDGAGLVNFYATVRNAGWQDAGSFVVTMEVTDGSSVPDILTAQCSGLAAGDETTIEFEWNNTWFTPPGTLFLTASATDPGGLAPDSWMPNNSASNEVEVVDFYPNETGWPSQTVQSIIVPPVLCDFDGAPGHDLEIVIATEMQLHVFRSDSPGSPIWESGYYSIFNTPGGAFWPSIPVAGNVVGDDLSDIVVDGQDELMIFNTTSTAPISSFTHSGEWFWMDNHTVALADFAEEVDFETRDEIVLIRGRELQVFDIVNDDLVAIRTVQLPEIPENANSISSWSLLEDLNSDGSPEIIVRVKWNVILDVAKTRCFIYDYDANEFLTEREWSGMSWRTIPAVGALPQGQVVALPTNQATSAQNPALLLDPGDLTTSEECQRNIGLDSYHVSYCIMADWDAPFGQADRILANTENQCFAWNDEGMHMGGFPFVYDNYAGLSRPPFPALGELDDHDGFDYADVVTATREGTVFAISSSGFELDNLGFPYTLPASVQGGFVITDIDNDGRVEVVFGTMDNYIHIWELGRCLAGYAPWPQCQHDAARTGVLEED